MVAFGLNMNIVGNVVRGATLPIEFRDEVPGLSDDEFADLNAFQEDGWQFTTTDLDWALLLPNAPLTPVEVGLLAKRTLGGLAILLYQFIAGLQPFADSDRVLKKYSPERRRRLPFGDNLHEVRPAFPNSGLESALQNEIETLQKDGGPAIRFIEPVVVYHIRGNPFAYTQVDNPDHWHWRKIHLTEAWKNAGKGFGTKVAVIDNGFFKADQIKGAILKEISLKDDGTDTKKPIPEVAHGTMCASLIAAAADGKFVNGAAPESQLILVAVKTTMKSSGFAATLSRCWKEGADVISCSVNPFKGAWDDLKVVKDAIDEVHKKGRPQSDGSDARGCVIVWAVRNYEALITTDLIESYDPLVVVAPSNDRDQRIASGHGTGLDLIAPGDAVVVIYWKGGKKYMIIEQAGASLAAPIVAGVSALIISKNQKLFWREVSDLLKANCDPVSGDVGAGRLNAKKAVEATPLPPPPPP